MVYQQKHSIGELVSKIFTDRVVLKYQNIQPWYLYRKQIFFLYKNQFSFDLVLKDKIKKNN